MPPKPAPKLTKKQLQQLKKQQLKKKQAEEKQRKQQEQARLLEKQRQDQAQMRKKAQQQRVRIVLQKQQYLPVIQNRIKDQNAALMKLQDQKKWAQLTEQYYKSYDTSRPKISTFIFALQQQPYENAKKALKSCQQAQIYVKHIGSALLKSRAEKNKEMQKYYLDSIIKIRKIQISKIQKIMIQMANSAEQMQQKNNQISKKGQPNKKIQGLKILEYVQHMNEHIKIGMFLNSSTTKNLNKFRPIQIKQFKLNTQIPSKWMNANTIVKFQWINFNSFNPDQFNKFNIIGGVYALQFYQLLLGSKKINNIILKKYYKGSQILQKFKLSANIIKEPFNVMYQIPKNIFLQTFDQSTLRFAQYDASTSKWSPLPNDTVIQYDPMQKTVVCKLYRPQPIAYIQDQCTDYPYICWKLRSIQQNVAHFDIQLKRWQLKKQGKQTRRMILKFEITDSHVKLFTYQKYPDLQDLVGQEFTPSSILYQLSLKGIYLLPINQNYQDAQLPVKDSSAQQNAIRDIAYAVQSYFIKSQINNSNDIIVKIRQNLAYQKVFLQDQQKDWIKVRWMQNNRCQISNRKIPNRHLNLEILLQKYNISDTQCLDRIKFNKNYLFKKNIMDMLSLTRVLSFTIAAPEQSHLRYVMLEKQLVKI